MNATQLTSFFNELEKISESVEEAKPEPLGPAELTKGETAPIRRELKARIKKDLKLKRDKPVQGFKKILDLNIGKISVSPSQQPSTGKRAGLLIRSGRRAYTRELKRDTALRKAMVSEQAAEAREAKARELKLGGYHDVRSRMSLPITETPTSLARAITRNFKRKSEVRKLEDDAALRARRRMRFSVGGEYGVTHEGIGTGKGGKFIGLDKRLRGGKPGTITSLPIKTSPIIRKKSDYLTHTGEYNIRRAKKEHKKGKRDYLTYQKDRMLD